MMAAATTPGNVAWVIAIVKNANRRSTTCTPTIPASTPTSTTLTMARCR